MRYLFLLCFAVNLLNAQPSSSSQDAALAGHDPVWLARGERRLGKPEHSAAHGYYTYIFASAESRAEFRSDPERYSIQMDGACARMGPASGAGSPDRWAVHAGRIYIFASDQCRASFVREPDSYLDPPEPAKAVNAEMGEIARKWLARAREAHGVNSAMREYREVSSRRIEAGMLTRTYRWSYSGEITEEFDYPKYGLYGDTVTVEKGVYFVKGKQEPHRPAQYRERARQLWRHPLALLSDSHAGVPAAWPEREGSEAREIGIDRFGATTRLGIDPATFRVVSMRYRGRGPEMTLGEIVDRFSDYRSVSGVLVPFRRESTFNGKPWPERARTLDSAEVNPAP